MLTISKPQKAVEFVHRNGPYRAGETAVFDEAIADRLIREKYCVEAAEQPKPKKGGRRRSSNKQERETNYVTKDK